MISKKSVHSILKTIKLCHNLGFIPVDVDEKTGEQKKVKKWRLTMAYHSLLLFNSMCYLIFMTVRLVQVLTTPELKEKSKLYLPFHAICCIGGWPMVPWELKLFFTSLDLNFKIYHDVLRSWPETNPREHRTIQDFVIMVVPAGFASAALIAMTAYFYAPTSPQYLYSLLDQPGSLAFVLCAVYENYILAFWLSTGSYGLVMQLLFLQSCEFELDLGLEKIAAEQHESSLTRLANLGQHMKKLRYLQLRMVYFNIEYAYLAYYIKLVGLLACTIGIASCIKLTQNYKLMSAFCGGLGLDGILIYAFIYDRGFQLPVKYGRYKTEVLRKLDRFPGGGEVIATTRKHGAIRRGLRSMGKFSVMMGQFHPLERQSTLLFLAFCSENICSIIISFPGQIA